MGGRCQPEVPALAPPSQFCVRQRRRNVNYASSRELPRLRLDCHVKYRFHSMLTNHQPIPPTGDDSFRYAYLFRPSFFQDAAPPIFAPDPDGTIENPYQVHRISRRPISLLWTKYAQQIQ
jgi:hypothetical protein